MSLSSAESEAKAITKGCIEALYVKHLLEHQTARPFKIELWTDSSSAKAILQRLGPRRRAKHLGVQTMWVDVHSFVDTMSHLTDRTPDKDWNVVQGDIGRGLGEEWPVLLPCEDDGGTDVSEGARTLKATTFFCLKSNVWCVSIPLFILSMTKAGFERKEKHCRAE